MNQLCSSLTFWLWSVFSEGCSETDSKGPRNWDQIQVPGLHHSMSMSDFMSHIEHCISEQGNAGNPPSGGKEIRGMLDDISHYLLSDNQVSPTSDEKSLMCRVNSLCCLLQDPAAVQNSNNIEACTAVEPDENPNPNHYLELTQDNRSKTDANVTEEDLSGGKQTPGMSRNDSYGDLLFHLPRIASLPKFLCNMSQQDNDSSPAR